MAMATSSGCAMDDEADDKDDTKRKTRNLSEKKRRDQFNMLVNELSTMVCAGSRKMDKSTVLKSTICFLKNHNETTVRSRIHDIHEDWKPTYLSNEEFTYLLLEALEGFLIVFSCSGKIFYVSESISSLLSHDPTDVVNKNIFDLTYDSEKQNLYSLLQDPVADVMQGLVKEKEIKFQCHLRRGTLDFREDTTYELIQFNGRFRMNTDERDSTDMQAFQQGPESRILFVGVGRLYTNLIRNVSLVDSNQNEFTSRHSLEWKFLFLDHRAPPIIGYLPFEVLGTSGYDYYHFDDLEKVVACHEALMQKGEHTSCYYRFLTKGQQWVWLQTRFYITYHQWNSKPEFIVCTHRAVSCVDVTTSTEQDAACAGGEEPARTVKDPPADEAGPASPAYTPDLGGSLAGSYHHVSRPASVKSTSSTAGTAVTTSTTGTAGAAYHPHAPHARYPGGSDTASMSSESWSSQRTSARGIKPFTVPAVHVYAPRHDAEPPLVPQHGIGAQFLEPVPYAAAAGLLPLPHRPMLVTHDQAQMQEQLQRKHEQLQQMIMQQQEELRQVKEQLLLARLGIIQPLVNVQGPYMSAEEMDQNQRLATQVAFEGPVSHAMPGYPPPHPPHPPHPAGHQQMPQ